MSEAINTQTNAMSESKEWQRDALERLEYSSDFKDHQIVALVAELEALNKVCPCVCHGADGEVPRRHV